MDILEGLWQDLRFALRVLVKNKSFTVIAAVMLALGIGANTAIFSVMHAVVLDPLPYKDPQRLALLCSDMRKRSVTDFPFSNATFLDIHNGAKRSFQDLAVVRANQQLVPAEDGSPEQVVQAAVSPNFFPMMGAHVIAGREFLDEDGRPQPQAVANPGAAAGGPAAGTPAPPPLPTIAILSYEYWQRRFGGNREIIGKGILQGGTGPQVVGILQPGFEILLPPQMNVQAHPDIWIAARIAPDNARRNEVSWQVVGRLKDGATVEQAQGEVDAIATDLRSHYAIMNTSGFAIRVEPMQK